SHGTRLRHIACMRRQTKSGAHRIPVPPRALWIGRAGTVAALLVATAAPAAAEDESANGPMRSGPYSFSDELGGFIIRGASGTGTRDDPLIIRQEILSASPVTMVIRAIGPIRPFDQSGEFAS